MTSYTARAKYLDKFGRHWSKKKTSDIWDGCELHQVLKAQDDNW